MIPLYTPTGPQQNVPVSSLVGWSQCYLGNYGDSPTIAALQSACTAANLMMACRVAGSSTIALLAWAARSDVLYDTGFGNTPHTANGVGWYFNGSYSWGFAAAGDSLTRSSCDVGSVDPGNRLCW